MHPDPIACEQTLHLGDIVNSTSASVTRGETRGSVRSPKWKTCSQANFPILEGFQIFPFEISQKPHFR